ncbi:GTPase-activating protein skywalker isoform X3 [Hydra vulgaris]|uniref:GTPase-activating protein skywalker isoform X3 n=1 Tax=Hydra vulgaris TaxID=6087 RepID=A0ABM4BKT3_HYDVU
MYDDILQNCVDNSAQHSVAILEQPELDLKENCILQNVLAKTSLHNITSKEYVKVKKIIRKNIAIKQRKQYWLLFSGGLEVLKNTPNLYKKTCDDLLGQSHFHYNLEKLATNSHFLTSAGCYSLCKILYVITNLNPNIVYCPMLEPIATVMLHFMNEEDTFACLTGILSKNVLDETKSENTATDCTMQDLLKLMDKKIFNRLESFLSPCIKGTKLVMFPSLKKMLFDRLSFANLVRVVDCFLIEGPKIFYRMGLYLLTLFHSYSLTFNQLMCFSPQDLVTTIVQFVQSLKIDPEVFVKDILKVKITSNQIAHLKSLNMKMCKAHALEFPGVIFTHQIVALDIREVSDIVEPFQWQKLCEWLPDRIQIKKPHLIFSTSSDGYNLKTLYLKCEEEEQTLLIIKTTEEEVIGAYLSSSLINRNFGKKANYFFGTGETFVFKLLPFAICYHWNMAETEHHISRYVFIKKQSLDSDDLSINKHSESSKQSLKRSLSHKYDETSRQRSLSRTFSTRSDDFSKRSFKRNLSNKSNKDEPLRHTLIQNLSNKFMHRGSHHDVFSVENKIQTGSTSCLQDGLIPLTASLPKNMHFGGDEYSSPLIAYDTLDTTDSINNKNNLKKIKNPANDKQEKDNAISAIAINQSRNIKSPQDSYVILDDETASQKQNEIEHVKKTGLAELFISCDNKQLVIGGGNGEAIMIDGDLLKGRSTWCQTFCNAPLISSKLGDFTIQRIDVFGFKEV